MFSNYLNIALIYASCGFAVALVSYYLFKKKVFGKFLGALIVAIVGAFFGGILEFILEDVISYLSNLNGIVNIFPPLITSIIFIWIFSNVSSKRE